MINELRKKLSRLSAFSLIEVVLAMGIFLITVLALVGLMGPALKSTAEIKKTDEVASVVDSVNAFLRSSPWINPNLGGPRFESIYKAIQANGNYATLFVYDWYENRGIDANGNPILVIRKEIGFENNQGGNVNDDSVVNADRPNDGIPAASYDRAVGSIYRVVLTASSAMLVDNLVSEGAEGAYPRYTLTNAFDPDSANYLALEVRIFAENQILVNDPERDLDVLRVEGPIFTYDMAMVRD